jgi:predicted RND superfamily exporter protein
VLVVVLVWVVFRSIRDALLALLPFLLSFLITFGVMGAIGVDLNPANLMVLPLLSAGS